MLRGEFVSLVKKINRNFRFFHAPDQYTNSSLWIVVNDGAGIEFVCGIPTHEIPEYSIINKDEFVRDRGWRAIFRMISDKQINGKYIVDRAKFWKVLAQHSIRDISQAILYETHWGNLSRTKSTSYHDYH